MTETANIRSDFASLVGQPAWRVSRIHGSMFFLEVGERQTASYQFRGEQREYTHGNWHFMFSMVQWRFERDGKIIIACEDDQKKIDAAFHQMNLGSIADISITASGQDLTITFDSGASLRTFSNTANQSDWDQWTLYCPDDRCWVADGCNSLVSVLGSEPRPEVAS